MLHSPDYDIDQHLCTTAAILIPRSFILARETTVSNRSPMTLSAHVTLICNAV